MTVEEMIATRVRAREAICRLAIRITKEKVVREGGDVTDRIDELARTNLSIHVPSTFYIRPPSVHADSREWDAWAKEEADKMEEANSTGAE